MAIKFTYFDLPALGEPVRLLLHISGLKWEDNVINRDQWTEMKPSSKWGQVPMATFPDGKEIAQSKALVRYLAKICSLQSTVPGEKLLYPEDPYLALLVDEFIEVCEDIRGKIVPTFSIQDQGEKKAALQALFANGGGIDDLLQRMEAHSGAYAVGDYMTVADVWAFCFLNFMRSGFFDGVSSAYLEKFPKLSAICDRVKNHPVVSAYYDTKDGKLYQVFRRTEAKTPIEVGYWAIRGLGAPLRMMCEYAGVKYEDKRYASGEDWFGPAKERVLAMNPLANLPYVIINGEKCVCQTNACMLLLGERFGMNGSTQKEQLDCRQLLDEIYDLRNKMIDLSYPFRKVNRTKEEYEESAAAAVTEVAPTAYKKLENWLLHNNTKFFMSDQISTPDFHIFEMIDQHEKLATTHDKPSPVAAFPKLKAFHDAFKGDDKLKAYFASDAYALPCNNPIANPYFV